jgi:hypothetical protein
VYELTMELPPETVAAARRLAERKRTSATESMLIAIDEPIATTDAERRSGAEEQPPSTAPLATADRGRRLASRRRQSRTECAAAMLSVLRRSLLVAIIVAAALPASASPPAWLGSVWRWGYHDIGPGYFINTGPDSARLVASNMAKAGAGGLIVRIQDPSGPSWKTQYEGRPAFVKDRDLVAELSAACQAEKMRFLGYIWALYDEPAWEAHPDWRITNSAGKPIGNKDNPAVCCNSPYRDLVRNRLIELARNYPGLHGVFFDMFYWSRNGCYCQFCRDKFKALTGQDPPPKEDFESPLWLRWQDFQQRSIEESMADWRAAIRQVRPDFVILANSWNGWIFHNSGNGISSVRIADHLDGTLEEEGWYWGAGEESFFGFPQRWPFMDLYLRCIGDNAARPDRCLAHMWEAGNVPPAVHGPLPTEEVIARVATMVSFGVHPWPYFRRGPQGMKPVFDFVKAREPWLQGAKLSPWCALVVSESTQNWYGRGEPIPRYLESIHGALRCLWERHLPVEIITDEDLERGDLSPYAVVLLENAACLSDKSAQRLRDYVNAGGGLVATYESSLYDEGGQKRPDFALGDIFGAKYTASNQHSGSLLPREPLQAPLSAETAKLLQANVNDITGAPQGGIPFSGDSVLVSPANPAESLVRFWCTPQGQKVTEATGLVARQVGRGKAVYLPLSLGKAAYWCNYAYLDGLMADSLRWAARSKSPVEVVAPRTVIAVPQHQGSRSIVHLLNDLSSFSRAAVVKGDSIALRQEVIPVRGVKVTFRDPSLKRFTLQPSGLRLTAVKGPDGATVTVPEVGWHEMVVGEP